MIDKVYWQAEKIAFQSHYNFLIRLTLTGSRQYITEIGMRNLHWRMIYKTNELLIYVQTNDLFQ